MRGELDDWCQKCCEKGVGGSVGSIKLWGGSERTGRDRAVYSVSRLPFHVFDWLRSRRPLECVMALE